MAGRKKQATITAGAPAIALPYGRVSTEEQGDEGLSLGAQQARVMTYISERGWRAERWYQDVESGRNVDRAHYQTMLKDARRYRAEGRHVAVVVMRTDRLGRRLSELARAYEELTDAGCTVHSVREGGELQPLQFGLLGTLAQEESRRLGERIAETIEHVTKSGWKFPGRVPWGYQLRQASSSERAAGAPVSVLDVHPVEGPYAREVFERVAAGERVYGVSRWVAQLPAEARGGRALSHQALYVTIRARVYVGEGPHGEPGRWPALVDRATWDAVQRAVDAEKQRVPAQASTRYLLTGMARCPRCGARMTGSAINFGHNPRYRCNSRAAGANATHGACYLTVSTELLDRLVLAEVEPLVLGGAQALRAGLAESVRQLDELVPGDELAGRLADLERMKAQAQREVSGLARALARGELTPTAYQVAVADAEADFVGAEQEIARLKAESDGAEPLDLAALIQDADEWAKRWEHAPLVVRRQLLAGLIEQVSYERTAGPRSPIRARIEWTPVGEYLRRLLGRDGGTAEREEEAA